MRRIQILCYLICISAFMVAGCAPTRQEIPTEEIRGRADRALDELQKEETGEKGVSEGERSSVLPPPEKALQEKGGAVQATKGTRPDWVDGESVQYPESRYLTGVGYDADRKVSEDKARAEIAKIFVSEINSRTRSYQDCLQISSSGKADLEETFSIQEITDVSTKKVFSGVRIAYLYQDSGPGNLCYALAVLDRQQSSTILIDRILRLDGEIDMLLDRGRGEGDLLYVERSADIIKHKAYRVSASEVEAVLQDHPTVIGACVIGVPDQKVGERIKAIVVLKEDARGVGGTELIKWCREHLAPYKIPSYIEFRDMLPKSKVGKLLRREVRAEERRKVEKKKQ